MLTADQALGMIEALDPAIFEVETQSTLNDRVSFLRVQALARSLLGSYVYLEVGSHIGGSLLPHLLDPACQAAVSADPRPAAQPDERAEIFHYVENSAARMKDILSRHLSPAAMARLTTIDSDVSAIHPSALSRKATLALIDAEHTDTACFSDFAGVLRLMEADCIISFHDANLIADAILNAERFLRHLGVTYETVFLPDSVAVMGLGRLAGDIRDRLRPHALERNAFLDRSRRELWSHIAHVYSAEIRAEAARLRADNARLATEAEDLREKGERLRVDNAGLAEERERGREAASNAQAVLAAIESSTTWRASAPVRAMVERTRRGFGKH